MYINFPESLFSSVEIKPGYGLISFSSEFFLSTNVFVMGRDIFGCFGVTQHDNGTTKKILSKNNKAKLYRINSMKSLKTLNRSLLFPWTVKWPHHLPPSSSYSYSHVQSARGCQLFFNEKKWTNENKKHPGKTRCLMSKSFHTSKFKE